jgi:hypothetical protein
MVFIKSGNFLNKREIITCLWKNLHSGVTYKLNSGYDQGNISGLPRTGELFDISATSTPLRSQEEFFISLIKSREANEAPSRYNPRVASTWSAEQRNEEGFWNYEIGVQDFVEFRTDWLDNWCILCRFAFAVNRMFTKFHVVMGSIRIIYSYL